MQKMAAIRKIKNTRNLDLICGIILVYLADSAKSHQLLWTILAGVFLFLAAFTEILFLRMKNSDTSKAHPLLILVVLAMAVLLILIPLLTATAVVRYNKAVNNVSYSVKNDTAIVRKVYGDARKVIIPDSYKDAPVTVIGSLALSMRNVEEIRWPAQLREIGYGAFHFCKGLTELELPDGLEVLGSHAFTGCSNLHRITIPASVKTIPTNAFNGCPKDMVIVGEPDSAAQKYAEKYFTFEALTP